tara:strand:+ start:11817 stop:13025 length:1209 start_codon:yes stop_codon:yes gene_type:complete
MVLPIDFLGKNFYVLAVTAIAYMSFVYCLFIKNEKQDIKILNIIHFFIFLTFLLIHLIVHGDWKYLIDFRLGISLMVFMVIAWAICESRYREALFGIIILQSLIQASFAIINYYFVPGLVLGTEITPNGEVFYFYPEGTLNEGARVSGVLLNPSLFGNMVVLGLLLFALRPQSQKITFLKAFFNLSVIGTMYYAVMLSHSRYPSTIATLVLIFYFLKLFRRVRSNTVVRLIFYLLLLTLVFVLLGEYGPIFNKLMAKGFDNLRAIKYFAGMQVVLDNWVTMLIGEHRELHSAIRIDELTGVVSNQKEIHPDDRMGIRISDNSFILLILSLGIIYTMFYALYMILFIRNSVRFNLNTILMLIYFLGALFLTSAIYWDVFIFYFFAVLFLLQRKTRPPSAVVSS